MRTWMDHVGNVHGRVDGANASAPALLIGSHYDTVFDAGKYDGTLGIITGAPHWNLQNLIKPLHQDEARQP